MIVIEEDGKIRGEMLRYLKELSIEGIHEFSSSREFEKAYFLSLLKKAEAPEQPEKTAHELLPDVVKCMSHAPFSQDKPFSGDSAQVTISADKTQILKADTAKIFDKVVTELVAKNLTLESLLPAECQKHLKEFLHDLSKSSSELQRILPIQSEKAEVWAIEFGGKVDGQNFILNMTDKTRATAKLLGKDLGEEPEEKSVPLKPIDLILFRPACVQQPDFKQWVTKSATLLKKVNLWPAESRPKFIAVRYEDDAKEKAEYNHPFIDDLLCLPFDRLIFLQKIEIALNLPKKASPSHLFVQPANESIEIAKKISLVQSNDLGLAIENPFPLAIGTTGHFYFRHPGQKPLLDVYAKAIHSTDHPEKDDAHLVYFSYFGMNKNLNKEIRAYLNRDTAYKNLVDANPNNFVYNPENVFFTEEQKTKKSVVILDIDAQVLSNTADYFKKEIHNIDVVTDDSYYGFFKKYLEAKNESTKAPAAQAEDFYAEMVSLLIGTFDMNIQMPLTPPTEEDRFLGHEIHKIFSEPQGWLLLFEGDARNLLTECLHLVLETKRINKIFEIKNAAGELRSVNVEFVSEDNGQNVRINFSLPDTKLLNRQAQTQKLESLECLIIDHALLPEDINAFLKGLKEGVARAGLRAPKDGPRVIVTATEKQKVDFDKLYNSDIFGFVYKPLEIRRVLFLAAQAMDTPFSVYAFENIGWKADIIPAKIARPATMVELSEFGATIKTQQPLKPGTMLYLFKSIFINSHDQNLCVRVYHSEENSTEEGTYLNSVVYFGITDAFLKFTRSYIREKYASQKAQEGQGG